MCPRGTARTDGTPKAGSLEGLGYKGVGVKDHKDSLLPGLVAAELLQPLVLMGSYCSTRVGGRGGKGGREGKRESVSSRQHCRAALGRGDCNLALPPPSGLQWGSPLAISAQMAQDTEVREM